MNENKFTPTAEEALRLAQEAAGELGHGYVGTEHLLLGLMREDEGMAHTVLTEAGLTDDLLTEMVRKSVGAGLPGGNPGSGSDPSRQARCGDRHGGFHPGRLCLHRHRASAGRYPAGGQQHGSPYSTVCRCGRRQLYTALMKKLTAAPRAAPERRQPYSGSRFRQGGRQGQQDTGRVHP